MFNVHLYLPFNTNINNRSSYLLLLLLIDAMQEYLALRCVTLHHQWVHLSNILASFLSEKKYTNF